MGVSITPYLSFARALFETEIECLCFSNASVLAVPNKIMRIQMIPFSDDSTLNSVFEYLRFGIK